MGEALFWPGGGSGSGGRLVVTAPSAGMTVTATNDVKTMTKPVNSDGVAIFRGLETGTWQLTCTDGTTISTPVTVEILADYAKTLTFFSATINVTFPVGSTCTATCGTIQLTATAAEQASGSTVFGVPNAGVWTITSTANDGSGDTASETVEINEDGQSESVELSFWNGELFENGLVTRDGKTINWVQNSNLKIYSNPNTGTVTIDTVISCNAPSQKAAIATLEETFDLTGWSTLSVNFPTNNASNASYIIVHSNPSGNYQDTIGLLASVTVSGAGTTTLDVSAVNQVAYISIGTNNNGRNFTVDSVKLS